MRLLVLAGGFGTRLQSIIGTIPKALAPIDETPFLFLQIKHWINEGFNSFVFLLHYKSELIIKFLEHERGNLLRGCEINWVVEPLPMGTGGSIAYAVSELNLNGNLIVTNADTWIGKGFSSIAQSTTPSIAVVYLNNVSRYGSVKFDDEYKVTHYDEKINKTMPGWVNAGLYHLNTKDFKGLDGKAFSIEHSVFPEIVKNRELHAYPLNAEFIDIGVPADYLKFCQFLKENKLSQL